jgi:DNA-binding winged helix-turn-helix (wHTH) protein/formylglycine-generating enzyme required for sulfatase activity
VDVTYRFNGFSADPVRRLLFGPDGQPIALKPRVFDTLLYLIEHRGDLLQKQALLDAIWPHVVVEENNLNQAISTLRRVLGETRDDHRFIVTEPGRGYRFVAPVETVPVESAPSMRGVHPSRAEAAPPIARLEGSAPLSQPPPATARPQKRVLVVSATALVFVVLVVAAGWIGERAAAARWAREEAIPEVGRLVDAGDNQAAFALAREVRKSIANDPLLDRLTPQFAATFSVTTTPAGADVYVRAYDDATAEWQLLGHSPLASVQVPRDALRWRFEKAGYAPAERATTVQADNFGGALIEVALQEIGSATEDMVPVPGGLVRRAANTQEVEREVNLAPYFIDRFEVTNADFKEFVDAGGYADARHWEGLTFVRNGVELSFEEARELLVDSTGQPGPASWDLGDYPEGQGRYPVTGVSRYEAAAYAKFRGKQLPTVFHWAKAGAPVWDLGSLISSSVPLSNFGSAGPVAVGSRQDVGPFGTYQLYGNVREWVANGGGSFGGWVLGGGFADPTYMSKSAIPTDPFTRSADLGFRLMRTSGGEAVAQDALAPVELLRTRAKRDRVSDEVYESYLDQYDYKPGKLAASEPELIETTDHWIKQRVVINTVHNERMAVYLFIPHDAPPKAQALIDFPGVDRFRSPTPEEQIQPGDHLDYIVRSRRVLVMPSFQGSYARYENPYDSADTLRVRREWVDRRWDLGATLDFLATRDDIDASKIGYVGRSLGGSEALMLLALESSRLKTAVLLSGGLPFGNLPSDVDSTNFLPRITVPVLMLNGKYDWYYTVDDAQKPLYELLGTPREDKRHYALEAGHLPLPRAEMVRLVLPWLDRYLGPVG